ncbi:hypothetical protein KC19_2G254600 [Ceratodon purpureus]|uniref:Uncharacterized protein n=1 Tax=Ceratodon purpureus TaxID=3225 RepID=A0A8T0IXW7_CERPU|nr:hypothetical protein KC19_2G254600 [Ceratodon purpureus]KAG0588590.1 hypothetical protein KC19_2G254600 [Ceratodon purpureus]
MDLWKWFGLVCVLASIRNGLQAADVSDLVESLPGQPPVKFKQYAGYVTVSKSHGRAFFYWFVEADSKKASSLPVAFWFNGGPGCSSVGVGALLELGPFFPNYNGTGLIRNKHSWNKLANIVFVESPASVGFSYSNTSSDYSYFSDDLTAKDNLAFTLGWYEKFPEYKKNELYLTGESFAGHYLPELAQQILNYNELQASSNKINFKGFAVGNPATDAYSDNLGATDFYHSHSLISDETYKKLKDNCDFAYDLPVDYSLHNATCLNTSNYALDVVMREINIYNIYGPSCNPPAKSGRPAFVQSLGMVRLAGVNPCAPDNVYPFLNSPQVKAALHARADINWTECSRVVGANYTIPDYTRSMLPLYRELLTKGIRIWVYSGDTDGVVPTTSTRYWLAKLNLSIETVWYPWNHSSQVGGWSQTYTNLTFATVRDAGHEVPQYQPGRALKLFKHFLKGQSLPTFNYTK